MPTCLKNSVLFLENGENVKVETSDEHLFLAKHLDEDEQKEHDDADEDLAENSLNSDFDKSESSEDDEEQDFSDSVDNGNIKSNCERGSNCEDVPIKTSPNHSPVQIINSTSPTPSCSDAKVSLTFLFDSLAGGLSL